MLKFGSCPKFDSIRPGPGLREGDFDCGGGELESVMGLTCILSGKGDEGNEELSSGDACWSGREKLPDRDLTGSSDESRG